MSQRKFSRYSYYEVQGDRKRDVHTDRYELALQVVSDKAGCSKYLEQYVSAYEDAVRNGRFLTVLIASYCILETSAAYVFKYSFCHGAPTLSR